MIKKISKTDQINKRLGLEIEGKVETLNSQDDLKKMDEFNKQMIKIRKEFIEKSKASEISASKVILNGNGK